MDSEKILRKLRAVQNRALTAAAYVLLAHVLPFVQIDTGALRQSGKVKDFEGGVAISFGDSSPTSDYAAYQYFTAKNHNAQNGVMGRILDLLSGSARESVAGLTNKSRYQAAYEQAIANGLLTKFPNGARWFEIIMKDEAVQRRAWSAYSGALRAA